MARSKIILTTSTSVTRLGTELVEIMKASKLDKIKRVFQRELDLELSRIFKFISSQMNGANSNFGILKAYLPKPWKVYSKDYLRNKQKFVGHLRWFNYQGGLQKQTAGVSEKRFMDIMGKAHISVPRGRTIITAHMAPRLRMKMDYMEEQLADLGILSADSLVKLKGRTTSYRPLIGPVFQYFMKVRLPQVARKIVKGQR